MKKLMLASLIAFTSLASIPFGTYELKQIKCYNSDEELKLGGKFMVYKVTLEVGAEKMKMVAKAKSGSWAPFKLDCTQINEGAYTIRTGSQYDGELPMVSAKCNAKIWEGILKKSHFGVEEQGTFNYIVDGDSLKISNPYTITRYKSCEKVNSYPVYYYTKK